jgi:hypothetical protein
LKNVKALIVIIAVILVIDIVVAPNPLATLGEGFVLAFFAYAVKGVFEADPYALAGVLEEVALILWLFGSIFWNLYVVHNYSDQSAAYTAAITAWFVPAFLSAIGTGFAYAVIEGLKKKIR